MLRAGEIEFAASLMDKVDVGLAGCFKASF